MEIRKPIIIIGTGRSGTTVFHHLFSKHPRFAWMSVLCDRFPNRPVINRLILNLIDWPVLGRWPGRRIGPRECYRFWDTYCPGFSMAYRDLKATDLTRSRQKRLTDALSKLLTSKRDRLLVKVTGWPRIEFFKQLFPDAKFIHVVRDGRAVANSMLNVDFWRGWEGPANWGWGELGPELEREWKAQDESFVALAGIQWKMLMRSIRNAANTISPEDFLEIRYETLCSEPVSVLKRAIEFSALGWCKRFERAVSTIPLHNANDKWKEQLTAEQQQVLNQVIGNDNVGITAGSEG